MPIRFLLSLLLLSASAVLSAQALQPAYPEVVRRFSTDDGLPQNSVNAIVQDRDGFLWLGTFGGLARFDGSDFRVYRSLADSGPSSDRILQLLEDRRGQLWIGSEDAGVSVYRDGRFQRLDICGGRCLIRRFVATADGSVWVVSSAGTYRVDPNTLRTLEQQPQALDMAAALGGDGQLYLGGQGLWRLRQGRREAVPLPAGETRINSLYSEGSVLWVGAGTALHRYDTVRRQWLPAAAAVHGALALARDAQQRLWVVTVDGQVFRDDGGGLRPLARPALPAAHSLLSDRDGNLWLGSNARGLLRIARSRIGLLNDKQQDMDLPGLPLLGDGSGGLWLGTVCGGLRHWDAPSGRLRRWSLQAALGNDCAWSLHRDEAGGLWIGTVDGRVGYLSAEAQDDRGARDSHAYRSRAPRLVAQWPDQLPIRALYRTAKHTLLVATGHGVYAIAVGAGGRTGTPQRIADLPGSVTLIQPAQQGGVWLAGGEGAVRWQRQRIVERWSTANGLSSRFVRSLYEQPDGTLWIGTYGGGLNRIAHGRVRRYDRRSGLFDDVVSCMVADARGGLWLSGNRGISLLPREELDKAAAGSEELSAIGFSESDGLEPAETNGGGQPACLRDAAGKLWFPLISGFAEIDPLALGQRHAPPPPVRIQSLDVGGRSMPLAAELRLPPRSHDIDVGFTAINLGAPEKTRFRYRLTRPGQEQPQWTDVGAQRSLHFPLLPWDDSTLEIIARSDTGAWSTTPARLRLRQPLPWYLSPAGWSAAATLLAVALLLGWRVHDYRLRRQRDLLAQLVRTRTHELEQANRRLADQAQRDPVTGIANHRHFVERQQALWAQMLEQQRPLSLLMIDVDEFKRFNDHYGHLAGDDCLRMVALAMAAQLREGGVLARYGGEEFVALLPGCDSATAHAVGQGLRQAVLGCAVAHAPSARHRLVTVSIGCATKWPSAGRSSTRLTNLADQALYRAKENGRNRVESA
jgi:diguanylate cyclase (GGDEF)-like protein